MCNHLHIGNVNYMKFNHQIHTKNFLLENIETLKSLCENSASFCKSPLAFDKDILATIVDNKTLKTAAHLLAMHQTGWNFNLVQNVNEILKLQDDSNMCVAAHLSSMKNKYVHGSSFIEDEEILKIKNQYGVSVAIYLALNVEQWMQTKASKNIDILLMTDTYERTVAHCLLTFDSSLSHQILMDKRILTAEHNGQIFAESFFRKHSTNGLTLQNIIFTMIQQGSAYRHSKQLEPRILEEVGIMTHDLINETANDIVAMNYALALYSTIHHAKQIILSKNDNRGLKKIEMLLSESEELILGITRKNNLIDPCEFNGKFCEPGIQLLSRLMSHKYLSNLSEISDQQFSCEHENNIVKY